MSHDTAVSSRSDFVQVASLESVVPGRLFPFAVGGEQRILALTDQGVRALDGICTHQYAELAEGGGDFDGDVIWCPLHAAGFDVHTGAALHAPAEGPLRTYEVRVERGQIFVSREPE